MRLRRYGFTVFAAIVLLHMQALLLAHDWLEASAVGRAYFAVASFLYIPFYVVQLLIVRLYIALNGGPAPGPLNPILAWSLTVAEFACTLLPFILIDWLRSRRSKGGNGGRSGRDHRGAV